MSRYTVESSFLGHRIPKEVKLLLKELKTAKKDVYCASIDAVTAYLAEDRAPDFSKELDPSRPRVLFGGFYCLVTRALRHKGLQQPAFVASLKELNFSNEVTEKLCEVVFSNKSHAAEGAVEGAAEGAVEGAGRFKDVDWRLDVVLSNNSLAKVLQPEVLMGLKVEGVEDDITLQLSQEEFHTLRQSTAKILHDMCQLRERKFMNPK